MNVEAYQLEPLRRALGAPRTNLLLADDVGLGKTIEAGLVIQELQSVTCATYNFEPTSQMWIVLREAAEQPGVLVTVYVDGEKADAVKVKAQLQRATVYRSAVLPNGKQVVSHAKFVILDHAMLLLTSANFSFSAENRNVEFGLRVEDPALAELVETMMTSKHGSLYELV